MAEVPAAPAAPGTPPASGWDAASAAAVLLDRERTRTAGDPLSDSWPGLDAATGYAVQDESLRRRQDRGERVVGVKVGLTSHAAQQRLGVGVPVTAWLTDAMRMPAGEPLPHGRLIHPRAEPEVVFVLGERLAGPGVTEAAALAAVESVVAGIEIVDSRFAGYRFTSGDLVADNALAAGFVTGPVAVPPGELDLAAEAVRLEVGGEAAGSGTGEAVLGHPARALALAANELARRGHALLPGWIVFTGALAGPVPVPPGTPVAARFTTLGSVVLPGATADSAG